MNAPCGNSQTIVLVVEDEPRLRMLAVETLEDAGFMAIEARDAHEAVAVLESRSDISLLVTDIDMPGSTDGPKLAHAVRGRWPPVKILIGRARLGSSRGSSRRTVALSESHTGRQQW